MKNKRGFTLIELLAVIVIISILLLLAIPSVTTQMETSRKRAFLEDAKTILNVTRSNYESEAYYNDSNVVSNGNETKYSMETINGLLKSKLTDSPFNSLYKDAEVIVAKSSNEDGDDEYNFYVCLIDEEGNGIDFTSETYLDLDSVSTNNKVSSCSVLPNDRYLVRVVVNGGVIDGENRKYVSKGESTTFKVESSNVLDDEAVVSCNNNQSATLTGTTLSVNNITSNTTCRVTFSSIKTVLYNDGTLIINENSSDRNTNSSKHGSVIMVYEAYSNSNNYDFSSGNIVRPWINELANIKRVELGQRIAPIITAKWFINTKHLEYADLSDLDTSNVIAMDSMFDNAGASSSVSSFTLIGLNNWNISNVKSTSRMFYWAGAYATNCSVGNLSGWNTSKISDMSFMFNALCRSANSLNIGDLSGWNTSNVKSMNSLFSQMGQDVTQFEIKGISNWDVSNVVDMDSMFAQSGMNSKSWNIGNLSSWDTSKVTNMHYMFRYAGGFSNDPVDSNWTDIGTLKVYADNIDYMFDYNSNVKVVLNIYSNPSLYRSAFYASANAVGSRITVNYSSNTLNIDDIISTKSWNSNVEKGMQLD